MSLPRVVIETDDSLNPYVRVEQDVEGKYQVYTNNVLRHPNGQADDAMRALVHYLNATLFSNKKMEDRERGFSLSVLEVGTKVKKVSNKPFKSGNKVNTISGYTTHPLKKTLCYTFENDESFVEAVICVPE
jgi:hypothetical protein